MISPRDLRLFFRLVLLTILCPFIHASGTQVNIATFNVEWLGFPENSGEWGGTRDGQLNQTADEILAMDADIVALQEVVVDDLNGNALSDLVAKLNAKDSTDTWSGVVNPKFSYWWAPDFEEFPAQRQAFVWRNSKVEYVGGWVLLGWIPQGDSRFASGRLPIMIQVNINLGNAATPLYLVNLHLKCCPGFDDRRSESMTTLIQDLHASHSDKPLVVLGDFNVADRGGATGEIAEWGFYADGDLDGTPDFFHGAGSVADAAWADIDHIILSDELSDPYLAAPVASRNVRVPSIVSDHDAVLTQLSWPDTNPDDSPLVADVPYIAGGIQVDGHQESIWSSAVELPTNKLVYGELGSASDLACETRVIWNETGIYFYIETTDDSFREGESLTTAPWDDDTLELYWDLDNSRNTGFYDNNDLQLFFNFVNRTILSRDQARNVGLIEVARSRDNASGIRILEIGFPWKFFGIDKIQGGHTTLGFDVLLNDDDDGGGSDAKLAWNMSSNTAYKDPSQFGVLRLGGTESFDFTSDNYQRVDHVLYTVWAFADMPASISLETAGFWAEEIQDFYLQSSSEKYRAEVFVMPRIITLPGTKDEYLNETRDLGSDIHAQLDMESGYTHLSGLSYDRHVWHFPKMLDGWIVGWLENGSVWINGLEAVYNNRDGWGIVAHELGHSLGLLHCGITLGPRETPLSDGEWAEYGSMDCIMGQGSSLSEPGAPFKAYLGWIKTGQQVLDPTPSTIRLNAHDKTDTDNNKLLRLNADNFPLNPGAEYWLSVRQFPRSSSEPSLHVHFGSSTPPYNTALLPMEILDMVPGDENRFNYAMPTGTYFWDSINAHAFKIAASGESAGVAWFDVAYDHVVRQTRTPILHAQFGTVELLHEDWLYLAGIGFLYMPAGPHLYDAELGWLTLVTGDVGSAVYFHQPASGKWYAYTPDSGLSEIQPPPRWN